MKILLLAVGTIILMQSCRNDVRKYKCEIWINGRYFKTMETKGTREDADYFELIHSDPFNRVSCFCH